MSVHTNNRKLHTDNWGLFTDFYELTMARGYFFSGKSESRATFNYFFRTNPFQGGFTVFAGLEDFLRMLDRFIYDESDIEFLKKQGFKPEFLDFLKSFHFTGNIMCADEGEIVFPNVPVMQVEGNLIECQLIESMLLNILNFESLIATKAFRIKLATGDKNFSDFGLRRAQGLGAIQAGRAAFIGGASSTSNVLAGKLYKIPVSGTQAHSWIQSFDSEIEAFRAFIKTDPENSILLVDTYDTLNSGVPNAIMAAKEMEKEGHCLKAIRLDSGDLAYLSKNARKMLDDAGLDYVKIIASNQLNEFVVNSLLKDQEAPIDLFGIGTEMITGKSDAALDGVYKLTEIDGVPKMKLSDNVEKITLPGKKQVYRCYDSRGYFYRDIIALYDEDSSEIDFIYHPVYPELNTNVLNLTKEPILKHVVREGHIITEQKSLPEIHKHLLNRANLLPDEHKRFISPHIYKAGISAKLMNLKREIINKLK
jgi:nicotinate phosphoribosyltransferase